MYHVLVRMRLDNVLIQPNFSKPQPFKPFNTADTKTALSVCKGKKGFHWHMYLLKTSNQTHFHLSDWQQSGVLADALISAWPNLLCQLQDCQIQNNSNYVLLTNHVWLNPYPILSTALSLQPALLLSWTNLIVAFDQKWCCTHGKILLSTIVRRKTSLQYKRCYTQNMAIEHQLPLCVLAHYRQVCWNGAQNKTRQLLVASRKAVCEL